MTNTLTVHHLRTSQSERIVWLCEELGLDYALVVHERDPVTQFAPPALRALTPMGTAPVLVVGDPGGPGEGEGDAVFGESGAIVDYLVHRHGGGRLALPPEHPDYAAYLHWLHFANGALQPLMGRNMLLGRLEGEPDHPVRRSTRERLGRALGHLEARLATATWLAGDTFTIADVMTVFSVTTMRRFFPLDLAPYPAIRAWLQRVGARDAYRRAMAKGDPDLVPMLT